MKRFLAAFVIVVLGVWATSGTQAQEGAKPADTKLETLAQKVSYSLGVQLGKGFGGDVDMDALARGYQDTLAKKGLALTEPQMREAMVSFQKERANREGKVNKEAGETFLAANKEKEGVVTLPSGMQYKVMKRGTGVSPAATDTVTVHYHGTLVDGTVFDSSVKRGQPSTFPLNRVIRGWTEGLQLMKTGGKWTFYIPSNLAYGPQRRSETIGPNCTLIFEVELISIQGK